MIVLVIGGVVVVGVVWAMLVVAGNDDDRMGRPRG